MRSECAAISVFPYYFLLLFIDDRGPQPRRLAASPPTVMTTPALAPTICDDVRLLVSVDPVLSKFLEQRDMPESLPAFSSDEEYLLAHEYRYVVAMQRHQALCSLRTSLTGSRDRSVGATMSNASGHPSSPCSPAELSARVRALTVWSDEVSATIENRRSTKLHTSWRPRLLRVAAAYRLSKLETDALTLLLLLQAHATSTFGICCERARDCIHAARLPSRVGLEADRCGAGCAGASSVKRPHLSLPAPSISCPQTRMSKMAPSTDGCSVIS